MMSKSLEIIKSAYNITPINVPPIFKRITTTLQRVFFIKKKFSKLTNNGDLKKAYYAGAIVNITYGDNKIIQDIAKVLLIICEANESVKSLQELYNSIKIFKSSFKFTFKQIASLEKREESYSYSNFDRKIIYLSKVIFLLLKRFIHIIYEFSKYVFSLSELSKAIEYKEEVRLDAVIEMFINAENAYKSSIETKNLLIENKEKILKILDILGIKNIENTFKDMNTIFQKMEKVGKITNIKTNKYDKNIKLFKSFFAS